MYHFRIYHRIIERKRGALDTTKMRTWAEIDLSALEHNYRTLRAMLAPGCRFL